MAAVSLNFILYPKFSKRSQNGWFRHWFNAETGEDNSGSTNDGYIQYFKSAMEADHDWFSQRNGARSAFWGLGAGQALNSTYAANSIDQNNDLIVSSHIVAGFLPENAAALADLLAMKSDRTCVYGRDTYEFLWRCSLTQPKARLNRVQAIDFSSTFLGLAAVHPALGKEIYRRFSP